MNRSRSTSSTPTRTPCSSLGDSPKSSPPWKTTQRLLSLSIFLCLSTSILLKGCSETELSGAHPCHAPSLPRLWQWHSIIFTGSPFSWRFVAWAYFWTGLRVHVRRRSVGGASFRTWPHSMDCVLARTRDMGQLWFKHIIGRMQVLRQELVISTRYGPFPSIRCYSKVNMLRCISGVRTSWLVRSASRWRRPLANLQYSTGEIHLGLNSLAESRINSARAMKWM